jgi:hypothetical protein
MFGFRCRDCPRAGIGALAVASPRPESHKKLRRECRIAYSPMSIENCPSLSCPPNLARPESPVKDGLTSPLVWILKAETVWNAQRAEPFKK